MNSNPTFYLASKLENITNVAAVASQLGAAGWVNTFEWKPIFSEDPDVRGDYAYKELGGVLKADVFCLMLPGGFGAHTEFGAALSVARISGRKLVVIHAENPTDITDPTGTGKMNPFYYHKNVQMVVSPLDALAPKLIQLYQQYYALLLGMNR